MSRTYSTFIYNDKDKNKKFIVVFGVSFGYSNGSSLEIVWESNTPFPEDPSLPLCIIVKAKGTSDWSGLGTISYYPAEYVLLKTVSVDKDKEYRYPWRLEEIKTITPGRQWKKGIAELKTLAKEIEIERIQICSSS